MDFENEIKVFSKLITHSPKNTELYINGFYNDILSEGSFRKLFDHQIVPNRSDFAHYIIRLTELKIGLIKEILRKEGEEFVQDITHFALKSDKGFSAIGYDGFNLLQIDKNHFSSRIKRPRQKSEDDMEIEFITDINDHGFFNWARKKPAHNNVYKT